MEMSQLWQIDATQWINPTHIVHIEDDPTGDPPTLHMTLATVQLTLRLDGPARDRVLQYLAHDAAPDEPQERA
jgi:hypothetical protein